MANHTASQYLLVGALAGAAGVAFLNWIQKRRFIEKLLLDSESLDALLLKDCIDESSIDGGGGSTSSTSTKSKSKCIYMDYNGTTPIYPQVLRAMMPYLTTHFGNPNSSHSMGVEPRRAVDRARGQILELLGVTNKTCSKDNQDKNGKVDLSSIWFTSCGTESDNLAIQLALQSTAARFAASSKQTQQTKQTQSLPRIVTCNVEHAAVSNYLDSLVEQGLVRVTRVPVGTDGRVSAQAVTDAIELDDSNDDNNSSDDNNNNSDSHTILVTLMLANNESGALQPVKEVAEYCRRHNILCHTDAAQAVGKVPVDVAVSLGGADLVSLVGHKIGAPKGVACLYVRPGCLEEDTGTDGTGTGTGRSMQHHGGHGVMLIGGEQEFGRRAGTENVASIVGFGQAAVLACRMLTKNAEHLEAMRARLLQKLQDLLGRNMVRANGPEDPALRLPNTLSVGLKNVCGKRLLAAIGDRVAASAGATCHSTGAVSGVLRAMQVPEEFARGTLRLSLGPKTTAEDVDQAADIISQAALRQLLTTQK
jgi:cysteine desulfurase